MKTIPFTRIATFAWMLFAILCLTAPLSAETVGLYFDPATPQIAFAAGDIKATQEKQKHTVETHDLTALAKTVSGKKIVVAVATDTTATAMLANQGGKPVAALGEQAYSLRTTTAPDLSYWALGGDANGTMHGGLQLAENIQFHGLARAFDEDETPHLKNRGIKFNLPLDKESPIDHILKHFAQLNDLPYVRVDLSCMYSEAHAHSSVTPSRWHRTGMEKGLDKYGNPMGEHRLGDPAVGMHSDEWAKNDWAKNEDQR